MFPATKPWSLFLVFFLQGFRIRIFWVLSPDSWVPTLWLGVWSIYSFKVTGSRPERGLKGETGLGTRVAPAHVRQNHGLPLGRLSFSGFAVRQESCTLPPAKAGMGKEKKQRGGFWSKEKREKDCDGGEWRGVLRRGKGGVEGRGHLSGRHDQINKSCSLPPSLSLSLSPSPPPFSFLSLSPPPLCLCLSLSSSSSSLCQSPSLPQRGWGVGDDLGRAARLCPVACTGFA
jgi:hypothetical protein